MFNKLFALMLFNVLALSVCFASTDNNLQYTYWNPLGSQLLNESVVQSPNKLRESSITMLLSQTEPVSFVLQNTNSNDVEIKSISVVDSKNLNNIKFDFRIVKSWYMGSRNSYIVSKNELANPILTPELLLKDDELIKVDESARVNYIKVFESGHYYYQDISDPHILMPNGAIVSDTNLLRPFVIKSGRGKQVWLNISTNEFVKPGIYSIKILVLYKQNSTLKSLIVPFAVEVLNVKLHDAVLNHSVYYVGQIRDGIKLLSTPKNDKQYIAELKDLKLHGVFYPTQYIGGDSESKIAQYLKIRSSLGFPCDKNYFLNGIAAANVSSLKQLESNVFQLVRIVKENTNCKEPKVYFYGLDEAVGQKLVAESKQWEAIHKAGGYVFTASYAGDIVPNSMEANLDSLIFGATLYNPKSTDVVTMHKLNKEVLLYNFPQTGVPDSFVYRKSYGYYLIKNNFSGAMPFAYQFGFPEQRKKHTVDDLSGGLCFTSSMGYCSVWSNFDDAKFYDHMFTYPTSDGVIDTVQWEGYAAAITDTRYYYTLIDLMQRVCKKNDIRCNFDLISLIDINDPAGTRQRITDKIKFLLGAN